MTTKTKEASTRRVRRRKSKKWVADVKTVSTFPPKGLFTKSAATIARSLASKLTLDVKYVGTRGVKLHSQGYNLNDADIRNNGLLQALVLLFR